MKQERIKPTLPAADPGGPAIGLTAIVPVTERHDDPEQVYHAYKQGLLDTGLSFEFIYVIDGHYPDMVAALRRLKAAGEPIKVIKFAKWFGESTALNAALAEARGEILLTLPAYLQVDPDEIPGLVQALDGCDMVAARRWPRRDSGVNVVQSKAFHGILRFLLGSSLNDLGCGMRVMKRMVLEEVALYGDQHRFLPLLAQRRGLAVRELNVRQASSDIKKRVYPFGVYIRRMLDILVIFFLIKFTKRPLRFFGMIGITTLIAGLLFTAIIIGERLLFDVGLADRPALILSTLLVVLGIQLIAVGLIAEIVIFTHAKDMREYHIEEIIE